MRRYPVNKLTCLNKHKLGFYMNLAAAAVARPETGDHGLLMKMNERELPRGQAQHKVLDAMYALRDSGKLSVEEKGRLVAWFSRLPHAEEWKLKRLTELATKG